MGEHKLPKHKSEKIMPVFVFLRQHDIELEAGFLLAGKLFLDVQECDGEVASTAIIRQLLDELKSGRLPTDAVTYGWPGKGGRPPNAVDTHDDKVMVAWAKDCITITVRVSPRNDGLVRLDSDIMRQLEAARPTD